MGALRCMNCKEGVGPDEGRLFAEVFVCTTCFAMAERVHSRCLQELKMLQMVLREAIRVALVEGRLQFPTGPDVEVSKRDVLQAILQLTEKHPT